MSDRKCARALIEAARRDIEVLHLMLEHEGGSDEVFGVHVQQAAEKLLKARLAIEGVRFSVTHDLESLAESFDPSGVDIRRLLEFTPFAVVHGYEALAGRSLPLERDRATAVLEDLSTLVSRMLAADPDSIAPRVAQRGQR
ncbi:MAG: HEPN domain-containing protein [Bryobacterales bacterium]|nr:HEPN domain-containing protein [Bryobacterales bacterium]